MLFLYFSFPLKSSWKYLLLSSCLLSPLAAQQPAAVLDSTSSVLTPLQQKMLLVFSPASLPVNTATVNGTLTRTVGGRTESGTVQFQFGDSGVEQESWKMSSVNRDVAKTAFADGRSCSETESGKNRDEEASNCLRVVPWFQPALAIRFVMAGQAVVQDVTTESDRKVNLTRLRFTPVSGDTTRMKPRMVKEYAAMIAAGSSDVLVDMATALPKRLEYKYATSSDPSASVDTAVDYSDYRLDSGLMIAHHIVRSLQRTPEADIQISSLTIR